MNVDANVVYSAWVGMLLWLLAAPPAAFPDEPVALGPYTVEFRGLDSRATVRLFRELSDTWDQRKAPPPTRSLLMVRIQRDMTWWVRALQSEGYFNAVIEPGITGEDRKPSVIIDVRMNAPFTYGEIHVEAEQDESDGSLNLPDASELGLPAGRRARYEEILAAEARLLERVREQGRAFARIESREVIADYAESSVNVAWRIQPGPFTRFGATSISGLAGVHAAFVSNMIPWKVNAPFKPSSLQELRDRLNRSGLFSLVLLETDPELDDDGQLGVHLSLTESKPKSFGIGAGYNTTRGPGLTLNWENRNVRGNGELFHIEAAIEEKITRGEISYNIPSFFRQDLGLQLFTRLADDRPPAYESIYWKNSVAMNWRASRQAQFNLAAAVKASQIHQFDVTTDYLLYSTPLNVLWDYRDNPTDPTRGGALFAEFEPVSNLTDQNRFLRERLRFLQLIQVWAVPQVTLSGEIGCGFIQGLGLFAIPPDERFYAGGSETVRGYAFQKAGPLLDGTPTGGRSLLSLSGELAVMVYDPVALVAFVDGGNVYDDTLPTSELLWGTGGGLRVYSPVGAIGVEVGFPLNRREGDDPYQFYITVGFQF